jgi:methionyl aminopeptidase
MIELKTSREIGIMREANQIVVEILEQLRQRCVAGVTTLELDQLAEQLAAKRKALCAFKGYRGYPFALCASLNEVIVHGMPSSRELREGDILSLDFGVLHRGFYGDAAVTIPIGRVDGKAQHLMKTTEECLGHAIAQMQEGNRVSDVSVAIQRHAEGNGFSVVRDFVGHGIGRQLHEDPQVPNFGHRGTGVRLKSGMVFAIEPMVSEGDWRVQILEDGWTAVTRDRSRAAHFEHSVAITENGPWVLSRLDD